MANVKDFVNPEKMYDGALLKKNLGLNNFKYIWVQKVINNAQPIFIITIDSRYPNNYLSPSKVKKVHSTKIKVVKKAGDVVVDKDFKLSPPLELEFAHISLTSNSIIIFRDIAGEYFRDEKMFESLESDCILAFMEG